MEQGEIVARLSAAAGIATIACSGASFTTGPRTAGGKLHDYLTPLECRFTAEMSHKASGLEPRKVNDIPFDTEILPHGKWGSVSTLVGGA